MILLVCCQRKSIEFTSWEDKLLKAKKTGNEKPESRH